MSHLHDFPKMFNQTLNHPPFLLSVKLYPIWWWCCAVCPFHLQIKTEMFNHSLQKSAAEQTLTNQPNVSFLAHWFYRTGVFERKAGASVQQVFALFKWQTPPIPPTPQSRDSVWIGAGSFVSACFLFSSP